MSDVSIDVLVIGSTNWDIVMYLPSLPQPGETVAGGNLQSGLGGKGANQAVAAFLAGGAQTIFLSCIGDDDISTSVRQVFDDINFPHEHVIALENTGTGSASIFVDADGENCIGITAGANEHVTPTLLFSHKQLVAEAKVVLVQLEIPMETVIRAAEMCRSSDAIFVLNPAPAQSLSEELISMIDILTPNEIELAQISGMPADNLEQVTIAARHLCNMGIGSVVTTLGAEGSLIVSGGESIHVPANAVQAIDTTAAGDVFNGTMAAELSRGLTLQQAVRVATIASGIAVSRKGAIESIPTRTEVLNAQNKSSL
ncbi:MAG: ribokinase [Pseudomonadales bacterium]